MNNSETPPQFQARCRHLRSKEMYHQAAGQPDDEFASGQFWCAKSQENFGPDGQPVSGTECCASRSCFTP